MADLLPPRSGSLSKYLPDSGHPELCDVHNTQHYLYGTPSGQTSLIAAKSREAEQAIAESGALAYDPSTSPFQHMHDHTLGHNAQLTNVPHLPSLSVDGLTSLISQLEGELRSMRAIELLHHAHGLASNHARSISASPPPEPALAHDPVRMRLMEGLLSDLQIELRNRQPFHPLARASAHATAHHARVR